MKKSRLIGAAMFIACVTLMFVLNWTAIARAASYTFKFGTVNALQFIGGITSGGASALPAKMNADSDGVSGHLVVDCSTGCSGGGGGGNTFPYNGAAGGQTATTASFLGIAGFNGTTVDPLLSINGGQLKDTLYDPAGDASNIALNGADTVLNAGINGLNTFAFGMAFNGTSWDRLQLDAAKNLKVTGPLTSISGTGTAQAANQMLVSGCAFNTALPTITTGNVGPHQCTTGGQQIIAGPLTGANSTGTVGAVNQAVVAACNFTTAPATVVSGNVVPMNCDSKANLQVNLANVNGTSMSANSGFAGVRIYPVNASGGGCAGANTLTTGTITRSNLPPVTITASEASTQIIALVASKTIHICSMTISGTLSTAGAINIITGTGTNCATGATTLWTYNAPASAFSFDKGTGEMSFIDSAAAAEICVSSGAFVATLGPTLDISYSQY